MDPPDTPPPSNERVKVYRHTLPVRLMHWINFGVLLVMLASGLQIFNAHPALYWGERSDSGSAWLALEAMRGANGQPQGITRVFGKPFVTTGTLGLSADAHGDPTPRGFPRWATLPSDQWLAMGRRWHFFFAWLFVINGVLYLGYSALSGHLRNRLVPSAGELRKLGATLRAHLNPRRLRADAAHGYNTLQKLSYLSVILILAPVMVVSGLAMSPWLDSVFHGLPELFGGRQSARSVHFLIAFGLVLFTLIHVAMVVVVGPINHLRAMITGYLRIGGRQ